MKKIKFSVGVLAFMGLAVINFTQSERNFVSKSFASGSGENWPSTITNTFTFISSSFSDVFTKKNNDCQTQSCTYFPTDLLMPDIPILLPLPGEQRFCANGNTITISECITQCYKACGPKISNTTK